jgi:hypothetical protein
MRSEGLLSLAAVAQMRCLLPLTAAAKDAEANAMLAGNGTLSAVG